MKSSSSPTGELPGSSYRVFERVTKMSPRWSCRRHPSLSGFALLQLRRAAEHAGDQRLGGRGHEESIDNPWKPKVSHVQPRPLERGRCPSQPGHSHSGEILPQSFAQGCSPDGCVGRLLRCITPFPGARYCLGFATWVRVDRCLMTCLLWADDAIEDRAEDSVNEFHRDFNVADARASATKGASVIRTLPSLPVDRGSEIALQKRGHVVGYMGDGINDAPSMRASDVGISVDTAVDVAKESADIILLEKSLLVFLPFLPMVPIQVLLNNLLYDASQVGIPSDQVDEEYLTAPRKWNIGNIQRFMIRIGPISSLFDYATFFLMLYFFKCILYSDAATPPAMKTYYESLFHTGWFVESILTQTLIVHIIRTPRIPFLKSIASPFLQFTTALVMIVGAVSDGRPRQRNPTDISCRVENETIRNKTHFVLGHQIGK